MGQDTGYVSDLRLCSKGEEMAACGRMSPQSCRGDALRLRFERCRHTRVQGRRTRATFGSQSAI